jgi:hypothetical protein
MAGLRAGWTRRSIPAHLGSADFANGIGSDTAGEFDEAEPVRENLLASWR